MNGELGRVFVGAAGDCVSAGDADEDVEGSGPIEPYERSHDNKKACADEMHTHQSGDPTSPAQ